MGLTNGALISDEKKNYVALKDDLMAFFRPNILQYSSESNAPGQFHRLTDRLKLASGGMPPGKKVF